MTIHTCETCNYSTKYKQDLNKHLKTKKHRLNEINTLGNNKNNSNNIQKHPENIQKHPENIQKHPEKYLCEYCEKAFTNFSNKRRHELHRCKYNNTKSDIVINQEKQIKMLEKEMNKQRKEMEKQRKDLMKQIEVLLTKVGNNNTTITNNIQLNNYGNEDLSHITNNQKTQMLKMPYGMIPKMIESVHFDDNKPENRNIMIVNKKDKYIKIVENGKWVYKDKKETIEDLIDGKYYILDEHYNEIPQSELNELQRNRYKEFQTKYDSNDNELHKKLIEKTEITLLNQME
jgi:hypothetical protein